MPLLKYKNLSVLTAPSLSLKVNQNLMKLKILNHLAQELVFSNICTCRDSAVRGRTAESAPANVFLSGSGATAGKTRQMIDRSMKKNLNN